jgi:hypothetical protein
LLPEHVPFMHSKLLLHVAFGPLSVLLHAGDVGTVSQ